MIDEITREAAGIANAIAALKARPPYFDDKCLVTRYLQDAPHGINLGTGVEINHIAHLPYPVWSAIRAAYYEQALRWHRETRDGVEAWASHYAKGGRG